MLWRHLKVNLCMVERAITGWLLLFKHFTICIVFTWTCFLSSISWMYMSARWPGLRTVQSTRRIVKHNLVNVTSWLLRQGDVSSLAMMKNRRLFQLYEYAHWFFLLRDIHCRIIFNPFLNPNPCTKIHDD